MTLAKYAIKLDENKYVKNCARISDTLLIVTLTVDSLDNAVLFNENIEDDFKKVYPKAEAVPVYIKPV